MSEMVERVAKAVAESIHPGSNWPWSDYFSDTRLTAEDLRDIASAAIAAMREPTDEMCLAVTEAVCAQPGKLFRSKDVWQAMIDEALK
jgi:hypothetical protein